MGKKIVSSLVLFSLLISVYQTVFAKGANPTYRPTGGSAVTFYLENDVFSKTDENYTHGCGLTWISHDFSTNDAPFFFTRPLFALLSLIGKKGNSRNVSLSFRQNIYTPRDISTLKLIKDDQPYAGITYFPIGVHEKNSHEISSLELDVGIVGPHSYAADSQKKIHELIDSPDPKGWNNQLKDEIILNLSYDYRWRYFKKNFFKKLGVDVLPHWGGGLGNMRTYANAGAQFRLGWSLPNNFGSYIIQPSCECQVPPKGLESAPSNPFPLFSIHFYTILDGQFVLRDIFLDGNTFKDSHRVDKNNWLGMLTLGVGIQIHRFKIDYSYVRQTRTFKTQKKPHQYGGITLSMLL